MKEELDNLYKEMEKEVNQIEVDQKKDRLNNKNNKLYWDIEKKYKKKAKEIKEKYGKN